MVPEEQKRQVHEAQATTYSTETGEVTEAQNQPTKVGSTRRKVIHRPVKPETVAAESTPKSESQTSEVIESKEKTESTSES